MPFALLEIEYPSTHTPRKNEKENKNNNAMLHDLLQHLRVP